MNGKEEPKTSGSQLGPGLTLCQAQPCRAYSFVQLIDSEYIGL